MSLSWKLLHLDAIVDLVYMNVPSWELSNSSCKFASIVSYQIVLLGHLEKLDFNRIKVLDKRHTASPKGIALTCKYLVWATASRAVRL